MPDHSQIIMILENWTQFDCSMKMIYIDIYYIWGCFKILDSCNMPTIAILRHTLEGKMLHALMHSQGQLGNLHVSQ